MHYSQAEENYLKALLSLSMENGEASINMLSKRLEIKMPTVNSMTKKMADKKLVNYESYKPISLTKKGRKEAAMILRKHRLTEMFLVQKMGFGWEEVHPIAEQIEHIQSPRFFEKMDELLDYPEFDPHGSPIPDKDGNIGESLRTPLSLIKEKSKAKFMAVGDSSTDFLNFLNKKNIQLGSIIEVMQIEPFDKSMKVKVEDSTVIELSPIACEKILVLPLE